MEKKLKEYRAKQEKLDTINGIRNYMKTLFSFKKFKRINQGKISIEQNDFEKSKEPTKSSLLKKRLMNTSAEDKSLLICEDDVSVEDDSIWCCTWLQVLYYFLYLVLWATIYMIFIKLQFGTVYLISSGLIFIYFNTRTTPKKPGEISAYSVFNKGCVSIDGTLKAEQFEREIMFGAGSVR